MKNQISIAGTILAVAGIGARGPKSVIPAKAGIQERWSGGSTPRHPSTTWIPAFAGMTERARELLLLFA